ncbi:redoxin domain-containing protein [Nocardia sp. NPDC048505]|uniref:peroxiredoxin family protein n=1 Tax=unclassified Nocardia TaxID=2637762 RepID=UPI0033C2AA5A
MLDSGTRAPALALEDSGGHPWQLADQRPARGVLLYFVRATTCPLCTRHARDLVARRQHFDDNGVRVAIVVPEDRATAAAWKVRHGIPYPVLVGTDPHASIGLTRKLFGTMQQSGTVLFDRDGVVRHAHGATLPSNGYDKKGIDRAIEALRS